MPCLKCQNLLLKTKNGKQNENNRMHCKCLLFCQNVYRLPNPIIEGKRACISFRCAFCFCRLWCLQLMSCLLFWKTKLINMPCIYSFVYNVYLKIMLITYVNLSDSRPVLQSATLLIQKFRGNFLMAQEPTALPSKPSNFLYKSHVN